MSGLSGLDSVRFVDVAYRFAFGGAAVALSAVVAKLAGGRIGGVFAAFPAVFISAVVTSTMGLSSVSSNTKVLQVAQGALIGMVANVVCAIAACLLVRRHKTGRGLVMAMGIWLVVASAVFFSALSLGIIH